jgi:hypothetical protein
MEKDLESGNDDGTVVESVSSRSELPLTCVICHEAMEEFHEVVSPNACNHKFHGICMYIWLARHSSCPICKQRIDIESQYAWRTLFMTALVMSNTIAVEQVSYIYAFLSLMLRRFDSSAKWSDAKDTIYAAAEQFEIGATRLPFLDLSSRRAAKKEKQKWKDVFVDLTDESPKRSERIQAARRWLIEKFIFLLEE